LEDLKINVNVGKPKKTKKRLLAALLICNLSA
jgi:hypothetical protein